MYILKHQNINGSVVAVTNTSTKLFDLINTAASTTLKDAGFDSKANALDIVVETGSIRISFGDLDPTSSKGMLLGPGIHTFRGVPLVNMRLIRTGAANVNCGVQVGWSKEGENSVFGQQLASSSVPGGIGGGTIVAFRKVVTTAGTAVPLAASSTKFKKLIIVGEVDNGNAVTIGGSAVIGNADATRTGEPIYANQEAEPIFDGDLANIYIDAMVSGEGVTGYYIT